MSSQVWQRSSLQKHKNHYPGDSVDDSHISKNGHKRNPYVENEPTYRKKVKPITAQRQRGSSSYRQQSYSPLGQHVTPKEYYNGYTPSPATPYDPYSMSNQQHYGHHVAQGSQSYPPNGYPHPLSHHDSKQHYQQQHNVNISATPPVNLYQQRNSNNSLRQSRSPRHSHQHSNGHKKHSSKFSVILSVLL